MRRIYRSAPERSRKSRDGRATDEVRSAERQTYLRLLRIQLDVPVRQVGRVQERQPLRVEAARPGWAAEERRPSRTRGCAQQLHVRLLGRPAALLQVASDATTDDVLPGGHAASAARNHVIEIQLGARRSPAAVLAGVAIARVDVQAREPHLRPRQMVVRLEQDYTRNAQPPGRGSDRLMVDGDGQIRPRFEVERLLLLFHFLRPTAI